MIIWVDPNPIWYPHKKIKLGQMKRHQECMSTEERLCENAARRWPSASQGQRPQKKPNLQNCEKINFCCFKSISLCYFMAVLANLRIYIHIHMYMHISIYSTIAYLSASSCQVIIVFKNILNPVYY